MQPRSHAVLPAVVRHNAQSQSYGDNNAWLPAIIYCFLAIDSKRRGPRDGLEAARLVSIVVPPSQQPG